MRELQDVYISGQRHIHVHTTSCLGLARGHFHADFFKFKITKDQKRNHKFLYRHLHIGLYFDVFKILAHLKTSQHIDTNKSYTHIFSLTFSLALNYSHPHSYSNVRYIIYSGSSNKSPFIN